MEYNNDQLQLNIVSAESTDGENDDSSQIERALKKRKASRILTALLIVMLFVFVGCLLLKWFWISNIGVSGESMMPNYKGSKDDHDVVWVNKTLVPKRGDVIVFYVNDVNKFLGEFATGRDVQSGGKYEKYIKRVVAMPGDSIWWERVDELRCVLKIQTPDGEILTENEGDNIYQRHGQQAQFYTWQSAETSTVPYFQVPSSSNRFYSCTSQETAWTIEDGQMFVMGDNRFQSLDSRALGTFRLANVYGVVINP